MITECNFKIKERYEPEKIGHPKATEDDLIYWECKITNAACNGEDKCILYQLYMVDVGYREAQSLA